MLDLNILAGTDPVEVAVAHARAGAHVFPCRNEPKPTKKEEQAVGHKAPLVGQRRDADGQPIAGTGGLWRATTDEKTIRRWWQSWPDALVGVHCGPSGLVVIDIDDVEVGVQRLLDLGLPPTLLQSTPSGGYHAIFRHPDGDRRIGDAAAAFWGDGMAGEVRAWGGYVIVGPVTMADGRGYGFVPPLAIGMDGTEVLPPADLNDEALALLGDYVPPLTPEEVKAKRAEAVARRAEKGLDLDGSMPDAVDELRRGLQPLIDGTYTDADGGRHGVARAAVMRVVERIQDGALLKDDAEALVADALVTAGKSEREAEREAHRLVENVDAKGTRPVRNVYSAVDLTAALDPSTPKPSPIASVPDGDDGDGGGPPVARRLDGDPLDPRLDYAPTNLGTAERLLHLLDDGVVRVFDAKQGDEGTGYRWIGYGSDDPRAGTWQSNGIEDWIAVQVQQMGRTVRKNIWTLDAALQQEITSAVATITDLAEQGSISPAVAEELIAATVAREDLADAQVKKLRGYEDDTGMSPTVKNVLRYCRQVDRDEFDKPPHVNTPDGLVDPRDGSVEVAEKPLVMSKVKARWHGVGVTDWQSSPWGQYLALKLPDDAERRAFQEVIGGSLLGGEVQKALFMVGTGGSGKSTVIGAIESVFGAYSGAVARKLIAATNGMEAFDEGYHVEKIRGRRLLVASEIERNDVIRASFVKAATGADRLQARQVKEAPVEFTSEAVLLIAVNDLPMIDSVDDPGLQRRLLVSNWNVTDRLTGVEGLESNRDRDAKTFFAEECADEILAWAIEGAMRFAAGEHDFSPLEVGSRHWFERDDDLGRFLDDWCNVGEDEVSASGDLRHAYEAWAEVEGLSAMSQVRFWRGLERRGVTASDQAVRLWTPGANSARESGKRTRLRFGVSLNESAWEQTVPSGHNLNPRGKKMVGQVVKDGERYVLKQSAEQAAQQGLMAKMVKDAAQEVN